MRKNMRHAHFAEICEKPAICRICGHHHTTTTILWPFFRDHPGELVPEENLRTLWCKGRLTEADTLTIRLSATPSRLISAYLHHLPIFFTGCMPFLPPNQQHQSTEICDKICGICIKQTSIQNGTAFVAYINVVIGHFQRLTFHSTDVYQTMFSIRYDVLKILAESGPLFLNNYLQRPK